MDEWAIKNSFVARHREVETCARCEGDGEERFEVAQAGDQTIYDYGPCPLCEGRGWIEVPEED